MHVYCVSSPSATHQHTVLQYHRGDKYTRDVFGKLGPHVVDSVSRVCFVLVVVHTRPWLVVLCACARLCELVFGLSSCQNVVVFRDPACYNKKSVKRQSSGGG